ncbi:DUF1435 domain-containing protein [Atlantibacter hermannii]|uniref:DUF1435 domain-containing protein n=1 Tax=Atlantibacter hermannii TaxID=565 RepID=UPI0022B7CCCC|nr:DUF1435 domain-containing protein [Atlantibacter hermannii]
MITVWVISERGEAMLQRALESGWGIVLPGVVVIILALSGLTFEQWRGVVVLALLATSGMLYHKRLRHFVLLPSCVALISGLMLIALNLRWF